MNLTTIARRIGSAYLSTTTACAVAHNLEAPVNAISFDVFQEASKTGGISALIGVIALVVMQGRKVEREAPIQ